MKVFKAPSCLSHVAFVGRKASRNGRASCTAIGSAIA